MRIALREPQGPEHGRRADFGLRIERQKATRRRPPGYGGQVRGARLGSGGEIVIADFGLRIERQKATRRRPPGSADPGRWPGLCCVRPSASNYPGTCHAARGARLRPPGYGEAGKPSRYTLSTTKKQRRPGGSPLGFGFTCSPSPYPSLVRPTRREPLGRTRGSRRAIKGEGTQYSLSPPWERDGVRGPVRPFGLALSTNSGP